MISVKDYLQRINYRGTLEPTADNLRSLCLAHLSTVPFENLEIHLKRPIVLDETKIFEKIVTRRRGGFCYELNGLFASLLRALGYDVTLLSARVGTPQKGYGQERAHLTLLVKLEERWLVDVGFGDSFREPLRLDVLEDQVQSFGTYRVTNIGEQWNMHEMKDGVEVDGYTFTLQPRVFTDFNEMCLYQQTSPASTFTKKRVCTLATSSGRITLSDLRLIETVNGEKSERVIEEGEYEETLKKYFGVAL